MIELRATKCHRISQVGLECAGSGSGEPEGNRKTVCFHANTASERAKTSRRRGHKAATDPQHTGCPQSTSLPLYPSAAPEVRLMTSKLFFGRSLGFLQRDGPVILSCTYFCFVSKVTRIARHEN